MAKMAKLIDTSLCQACKACQVACKQWNQLPAVTAQEGLKFGSYQNPPDLNWHTWNLVRFTEVPQADGSVHWAFNKDSCRHCPEPFCKQYCPVEGAITIDPDTKAVVIHSELCGACCAECVQACPYDIPRLEQEIDATSGELTGVTYARAFKCRLCVDRLHDTDLVDGASLGLSAADRIPACAKTCPAGAISFGTVEDMMAKAQQRLATVWPQYPGANIYPGMGFGCMWLLTESPDKLGLPVSAPTADATPPAKSNRREALAGLLKPLDVLRRG